ncbi:AsmA family protein [Salinivibrio sp. EAGSL]|uniref:AsmA family protein n=1 Tax=Salinivibrio sp. EAGSL TaxID=2738468 RepID=UPI00158D2716|nr:AsmA family protein [Salinivibrio sp. EAGSL]NUY55562.1 AsmA family protein [Salinivibrio sp. EAGSL]
MIKKIVLILAAFVVVLIGAVATLIATVNPNQFKPLLVEQVAEQTGYEVVIGGDIEWQFWPSLGFSIAEVAIKNRPGFDEPDLLRLSRAQLSVDVLPLMSQTLQVGEIVLQDPHVFIQTLANGDSNVTPTQTVTPTQPKNVGASAERQTSSTSSEPASQQDTVSGTWQVSLQGLRVTNASVVIKDDQVGTQTALRDVDLQVGNIATDIWTPLTVSLRGEQDGATFSAQGQGELKLAADPQQSQLRELALNVSAQQGEMTINEANITLDRAALGQAAQLGFNINAQTSELKVETSGNAQVTVAESQDKVTVQGLDMLTQLSGDALPGESLTQELAADIVFDAKQQTLDITEMTSRLNTDEVVIDGKVAIKLADIPQIRFALNTNHIDLDTLLPTDNAAPRQSANESQSGSNDGSSPSTQTGSLSQEEPDLRVLKTLDIAGSLAMKGLTVSNVTLGQTRATVAINRGKVDVSELITQAYEGRVVVQGMLDATQTPARYQVSKKARNIAILPLLEDVAQVDLLEGKGNVDINLQGQGLSPYALRQAIQGSAAIFFEDGAINGINLAQMLREAKATLKGEATSNAANDVRKTDFSALTASFTIGNGMARTNDLLLEAPALRVRSEGQTDLLKETLDFDVFTSVVETSKGQGGKDIDELRDVTIPVTVAGTWQSPSYQLDIKQLLSSNKVLEEKARKEAQRGIKKLLGDKADDDKVKEATDKLLNLFQ